MLPRSRRLRADEVRKIIANGKSVRGAFLSAKFLAAQGDTIRTASVVSKKLAKTAVKRNELRRAIYRSLESFPLGSKGFDVVFFLRFIPPEPIDSALGSDMRHLLRLLAQAP